MNVIKRICEETYFIKGWGILGVITFAFSSIVITALGVLGFGICIGPIVLLICFLLAWAGFGTLAGLVASFGYILIPFGAYLMCILYFAQINVKEYKDMLPSAFDEVLEIRESLSLLEWETFKTKVDEHISKAINEFRQES